MSKSDEIFPLCKHLDEKVDELRQFIPAALDQFDPQAIHKARVTTRRLKAAIELLESVLHREHAKPFEKLGKKLRRRLGPLRDVDVMLSHLDEIKPTTRLAPPADWLRQKLLAQREEVRTKSADKISASAVLAKLGSWWALRQDVIEAHPAVSSLLAESLHLQLDRFGEQAQQLAANHDPHQLRIAGKSLRYTLELAQAQGHKVPKNLLKTFKQMQESLGAWHDYVVLAECAMETCLAENLPVHDAAMQRQILDLIDHAMVRASRELEKFEKFWTENGGELVQKIRDEFPLTQPAKAPQTDPGPADSPPPPATETAAPDQPPAA